MGPGLESRRTKKKRKRREREEEKIARVAGRNEGADEEREGFGIALPHKAKETLEYDGRCKNKSFLFKCPFSSLFALPSTLHHRSVYDPVRRSSLWHPSRSSSFVKEHGLGKFYTRYMDGMFRLNGGIMRFIKRYFGVYIYILWRGRVLSYHRLLRSSSFSYPFENLFSRYFDNRRIRSFLIDWYYHFASSVDKFWIYISKSYLIDNGDDGKFQRM